MSDSILVLMRRGEATMNVPVEKLDEYIANGWREISRQQVAASSIAEEPAESSPEIRTEKPKAKAKS